MLAAYQAAIDGHRRGASTVGAHPVQASVKKR